MSTLIDFQSSIIQRNHICTDREISIQYLRLCKLRARLLCLMESIALRHLRLISLLSCRPMKLSSSVLTQILSLAHHCGQTSSDCAFKVYCIQLAWASSLLTPAWQAMPSPLWVQPASPLSQITLPPNILVDVWGLSWDWQFPLELGEFQIYNVGV